jgi:hypothetical protein
MDIWGHCPACDRWFYCPIDDGDRQAEPTWLCPVCRAEPTAIENRAAPAAAGRRRPRSSEPSPRRGDTTTA